MKKIMSVLMVVLAVATMMLTAGCGESKEEKFTNAYKQAIASIDEHNKERDAIDNKYIGNEKGAYRKNIVEIRAAQINKYKKFKQLFDKYIKVMNENSTGNAQNAQLYTQTKQQLDGILKHNLYYIACVERDMKKWGIEIPTEPKL